MPAYYTKIQILRINGLRIADRRAARARKDLGVAALGATNKMFWSEMHREAMELALDISGTDAHAPRRRPDGRLVAGHRSASAAARATRSARCMSAFFFSRSETIWGGTAEIQRNIVGERVLGLPREPKVEERTSSRVSHGAALRSAPLAALDNGLRALGRRTAPLAAECGRGHLDVDGFGRFSTTAER